MCIPRLFLTQVVDLYWYPLEYTIPKGKGGERERETQTKRETERERERHEHLWDQNELRFFLQISR